ncbi:MAG: YciI family protein [Methanoregula sp.]|nr:YciI family protein [Methanoregula sp.]
MSDTIDFISLIRPKRTDFLATMTSQEKAVMGEHRDYVRSLFKEGRIVLSGEGTEGTIGVVIYRVYSADEARRLFYNDPAVIAGIGYPELHPFEIGLLAAN